MRFREIAVGLLAVIAVFFVSPVRAQDYPSGPINMVVPWAPGSTGDIIHRILTPELEKKFGHRILLDNRPGAGGNIGTSYVAKSAPDGYTILLGPSNVFTLNHFLYSNTGFDPLKDFVPITKTHDSPYVLYVGASVPANTAQELVAFSKSSDKPVLFGSSGLGSPGHMAAVLFRNVTGANVEVIPYSSSSQAVTALLQGEVHAYIASAAVGKGQVEAGGLRVLMIAGAERIAVYPDAPSAAESEWPEFAMSNWWGLAVPAETSPEIVSFLERSVREALATPQIQERIKALGALPADESSADLIEEIKTETLFWEQLVQSENIKAE